MVVTKSRRGGGREETESGESGEGAGGRAALTARRDRKRRCATMSLRSGEQPHRTCIFFAKVTTSGGEDRPQASWAQNVPVAHTPVCTSSTIMYTLRALVMSRTPRKNAGEAWLSPPSPAAHA